MSIVTIENLSKTFIKDWKQRKTLALDDVSFELREGSITGFLGRNGAGKTTTIKCLLRLIHFSEGKINIFGSSDWSEDIRSRIGFLPEKPNFYDFLKGREVLEFYARLSRRVPSKEVNETVKKGLEQVGLGHAGGDYIRNYSKGMVQRLGLAQAIVGDPELIILDEPMSGLDPDGRKLMKDIILESSRKKGATIFFSSHLLHDVESLSGDLVIVKKGKNIFSGSTETLLGKFFTGFHVSYLESGEWKKKTCQDVKELQKQIDTIRSQGHSILGIDKKTLSLEEAFVELDKTKLVDTQI